MCIIPLNLSKEDYAVLISSIQIPFSILSYLAEIGAINENLPIPLWTFATFSASTILITCATYKRYKGLKDTGDQWIFYLSALATVAMWMATISLSIGYLAGGAWLALADFSLFLLTLSYPFLSFIEAGRKLDLAPHVTPETEVPKSKAQATVRFLVEAAGMFFSIFFVHSCTLPVTACYLSFVSCQIIWDFIPRKYKNDVKKLFGLDKSHLVSEDERLQLQSRGQEILPGLFSRQNDPLMRGMRSNVGHDSMMFGRYPGRM